MKKLMLPFILLLSLQVHAQKFMTKTGSIDFVSKAPMETITGVNKSTACLLDATTGSLDFVVLIKSFVFEKQLMQEHFNENYMESGKFPKATFKGQVLNPDKINFARDGEYEVSTAGKLTIHGVSKDLKQKGKVVVKGSKIMLVSNFSVLVSDFNISIPGAVRDKVSKEVKINVNCALELMK